MQRNIIGQLICIELYSLYCFLRDFCFKGFKFILFCEYEVVFVLKLMLIFEIEEFVYSFVFFIYCVLYIYWVMFIFLNNSNFGYFVIEVLIGILLFDFQLFREKFVKLCYNMKDNKNCFRFSQFVLKLFEFFMDDNVEYV